ncbi:MAG TPA: xanthine dehydrogenase family protein molybdopterin-binding subunit [Gemmatimonadales bacterium]|nr:xanthine dehydrogenase family protein molybdopterin-binding subunit [Gemmatimonadales bacterium]
MSSRITRREFVETSAGLVIAFYLPPRSQAAAPSPAPAPADAGFAPNAWLRISTDGVVTLTVDKSEMGQGSQTGLAMILAEELEADWSKVRLGPVPENPAGWSRRMSTGGSTAIRTSWDMLRKAGASAREMLISAAALHWQVDRVACRAQNGAVIHAPSGRRLGYGALASRAATVPVPENPPLKDPKDFRLLGTRVPRLDTPAKVDGTAAYGIDVKVPGMLIASIERCPVFGGTLKRYDGGKAKASPGVRAVVALEPSPWTGKDGAWGVGCAAAVAVVADTYWHAVTGRRALEIEWDEGEAALLGSDGIRAQLARLAEQPGVEARKDGDPVGALAAAAKRVEAVYEVPFLHHATMEPMNCTAHVRADDCDVWAPTQNQTRAQEVAAELTGLPKERVRIHTTLLGGGFGRRLEPDFVSEAVRLSKAVGAPVKVIWSREDDVQHGFYRPATYNRFAAALDATGTPVVWTHRIVAPPILLKFGPLEKGIDRTLIDGASNLPYGIPNVSVDQVAVDLLPIPRGFWRSVGISQNGFVTECFFDEVAAAGGKDPYELRRQLLQDKPRHRRTLELAAEQAGWGTPLPAGRGRGIAIAEWAPTVCAQVAEVSVAPDGAVRVHRVVCAVDCGPTVNVGQIEAQLQGGIVYGLTAALYGEITIERGRVKQSNFTDYPMLHLNEMPEVAVHIVPSSDKQGGIGEPSVGPIAPALCNAIFAATGKRIRKLPIGKVV